LSKKTINIVWFKRDLRFTDHEPLYLAQKEEIPVVFVYFFEPSVMNYDDSDVRHCRFVYESIQEMQTRLKSVETQIYFFHNEVNVVFEELTKIYDIKSVFSHQEIGNKVTFDRDSAMQSFFD
jgi:deoxyribodipyrimidine photo-lyase